MHPFRSSPFSIRSAGPAETPLLVHLHLAHLWCLELDGHPLDRAGAYLAGMPAMVRRLVAGGGAFLAEAGGEVVAAAGWEPAGDTPEAALLVDENGRAVRHAVNREIALIRTLFVHPGWAELDLARRIVAHAELAAARAGRDLVDTLAVGRSAEMYRSIGYVPVRRLNLRLDRESFLPVQHLRKALPALLDAAA
jgi:GNAT superfamily N-acetyltransferase